MSLFVPLFVGKRYTKGKNRNRFGSIVGLFSLIGMALGVSALIIVLSVMNGFRQEIELRIQTLSPHITLLASGTNSDFADVSTYLSEQNLPIEAKSPTIESFAMLQTRVAQNPIKISGIDPEIDGDVVELDQQLFSGRLETLQAGEYGIILGRFVASNLGVGLGDELTLLVPKLRATPAGLFPRQKKFRVTGLFESGSQLDNDVAYIHYQDLARVLGVRAENHGWRIRLQNVNDAEAVAATLNSDLNEKGYVSQTWIGEFSSLFRAMKMEKVTVGLLLMIIVIVAAFNIISGLIMMVADKRSDMAVLRTMGANASTVVRIFIVQGLILGWTGVLIGACIGTLVALYLSQIVSWFEGLTGIYVFDPDIYYVAFLPSDWQLADMLWVVFGAGIMTILATLAPAIQAAKISPTEALNYKQ